jgi:hypothetical protein
MAENSFMNKIKNIFGSKKVLKNTESVGEVGNSDFQLRLAKHMKEMESSQKELISVLKEQNVLK